MKLLLTKAFMWESTHLEMLSKIGFDIIIVDREDGELSYEAKQVDVVVCNWLFVHHRIEDFPNLKFIQLLSAGLDRIPLKYAQEHEITIKNAKGVYSIPMAEFVLSNVLGFVKSSNFFAENKKKHIWEKKRDLEELFEKNILIVGCGSVGTEVAKKFSAFSDNVYGIDMFEANDYDYFKKIYSFDNLDRLLKRADITILTLPLTSLTYHLFNRERMLSMKKKSILVNIARGHIIDEDALPEVLKTHLGGLIADTFEDEPLPKNSPLWDIKNAIITPHNSFASTANQERLWNCCFKNLQDFINQNPQIKVKV